MECLPTFCPVLLCVKMSVLSPVDNSIFVRHFTSVCRLFIIGIPASLCYRFYQPPFFTDYFSGPGRAIGPLSVRLCIRVSGQ